MNATVNIDTGGTFTDGYFTRDGQTAQIKVDTTPHDFTECLMACITAGAGELGYDSVQSLLLDTAAIRFSSTIGTNTLVTRSGPRVGVLVSEGAGSNLYADGESPLFDFLVRRDLVAEIPASMDEGEIIARVRDLLVRGARILVVSLDGSDGDPSAEEQVKAIVRRQYPRHYLGAVACLLASEMTPHPGTAARTATAVLNAYLHSSMVRTLYKADEDLRTGGYPKPMLVVHASGGTARVAKTKAVETYNSGPVAGVYGARRMAELYGLDAVVTMDVGGTSTDIAVVVDRELPFASDPEIEGIDVVVPMVEAHAIAAGGGSIARAGDGGVTVGPDSAGASPGPASYGLGGADATPTDAELVLGTIAPDWFFGGRRRLDPDRARTALERIGPAQETAQAIHDRVVEIAAAKVASLVDDPARFTLFGFGGGGGLYAADVARKAGIPRVALFLHAPVFSAFGVSGMDLGHVYEVANTDGDVERATARAKLDIAGEGFDPDTATFTVEDDSRLRATVTLAAGDPPRVDAHPDTEAARKGEREVHGIGTTVVLDRAKLGSGAVVDGPALVESIDTTVLVPPGARLTVDDHGTGWMEV